MQNTMQTVFDNAFLRNEQYLTQQEAQPCYQSVDQVQRMGSANLCIQSRYDGNNVVVVPVEQHQVPCQQVASQQQLRSVVSNPTQYNGNYSDMQNLMNSQIWQYQNHQGQPQQDYNTPFRMSPNQQVKEIESLPVIQKMHSLPDHGTTGESDAAQSTLAVTESILSEKDAFALQEVKAVGGGNAQTNYNATLSNSSIKGTGVQTQISKEKNREAQRRFREKQKTQIVTLQRENQMLVDEKAEYIKQVQRLSSKVQQLEQQNELLRQQVSGGEQDRSGTDNELQRLKSQLVGLGRV